MQWLTECVKSHEAENSRQKEQHSKNEQCPNVLVFMCKMRGVLESEEEPSCLDGE